MGQELSHHQDTDQKYNRIHSKKKLQKSDSKKSNSDSTSIETGYYSGSQYSSCSCLTTGSSQSTPKSQTTTEKQKDYLSHHLYIKTYLDILEEDKKAKEYFQTEAAARPGIRNYTPKIYKEEATPKSQIQRKDELWI